MELIKPSINNINRSCVYKMTINQSSFYIGSTTNLIRRITQFKHSLKNKSNRYLNKNICKIIDEFSIVEFSILEIVRDAELLRHREDYQIKKNWGNPLLLNRSSSAFGNKGVKLTQDELAAISMSLKGRKHTPEQNEQKRLRQTGRVMSDSAKKKISIAKKGKPFSDQHRHKLSMARMGVKPSALTIERSTQATRKRVEKIDKSGNIVGVYNSYTEAAASVGSKANHISMVVSGHRKSLKGFIFRRVAKD